MLQSHEREELEALRDFKRKHELRPLEDAFEQLQRVLKRPNSYAFDAIMPVSAYRILAECVIRLKEELIKE